MTRIEASGVHDHLKAIADRASMGVTEDENRRFIIRDYILRDLDHVEELIINLCEIGDDEMADDCIGTYTELAEEAAQRWFEEFPEEKEDEAG